MDSACRPSIARLQGDSPAKKDRQYDIIQNRGGASAVFCRPNAEETGPKNEVSRV